jgi:hypothetical protein
MRLAEDEVMSLPRKLVEHIILGLYDQINVHLVKLIGFEFSPELRRHFRRELETWLTNIESLRFKPNNRTGSYRFYFDLFFEYPFGGVEVENMRRIMDLVSRQYETLAVKSPEELVGWLRHFHEELAQRLHDGEDVLDMIPE